MPSDVAKLSFATIHRRQERERDRKETLGELVLEMFQIQSCRFWASTIASRNGYDESGKARKGDRNLGPDTAGVPRLHLLNRMSSIADADSAAYFPYPC
jgi:hypothetical protein